ncbi:MAG TPA: hypothetical protein ENN39_02440 [Desulfonatronum sp.]|nr:hypothetical protein [Desulfonatronum sp.]
MKLRTCVTPFGFCIGVHDPSYNVANLREQEHITVLGLDDSGQVLDNRRNFPGQDVAVAQASRIYEIPNAFPFRGTTYIDSSWADAKSRDPASIRLPAPVECSLSKWFQTRSNMPGASTSDFLESSFESLPEPLLLALAATTTDPEDLRALARISCDMVAIPGPAGLFGLQYAADEQGRMTPVIRRHDLFEVLVNNPHLPDELKRALVLRPGVQGDSEIVGDVAGQGKQTHVFEYLRRNSYIPWGHYAANMADDTVRYAVRDLSLADIRGLRHLYYQRTYVRLAEELGLAAPRSRCLDSNELEGLRLTILAELESMRGKKRELSFNSILWGWNFGFDFAPSGYRLHASHQQVHQQYALIPSTASFGNNLDQKNASSFSTFACGDLVAEVVARYRAENGQGFFQDYLRALRGNRRTNGRPGPSSLIVHEDDNVVLFVPKAQTSGWELQLMPVKPVGNILEANADCRRSLDRAMLTAQKILEGLGARMVSSFEYSRRLDSPDRDQRLLYAFLPKLPYAPGGFSEAQLRNIVGHYPEDFAAACREALAE